jgi:UDP-N-acetylmuramate--alanine ligase
MEKFHLIGVKGTGMSALAGILKDLGHEVTGSDVEEDFFTSKKLEKKAIKALSFGKNNITDDKVYIASACYREDNEEVGEVIKRKLPFFYYHNFIGNFFQNNKIGISGTHGKTTTTSIVTKFFEDKRITYLIGDGSGGGSKDYNFFIFEACEYQNHFLNYNFDYLVINNIELDHPDFFKNVDEIINSFQKAANKAKCVIINADDENCRKIKHHNIFSFGLNSGTMKANILETLPTGFRIEVGFQDEIRQFYLPFTGIHMIYNFLAALSVAYLNGINLDIIQEKLLSYIRPSRRMEEYFYYDNVIIDDYAHHPREIEMCLAAIRQKYQDKDLIVIFQPHTYSRTMALKKEFRKVFSGVKLYLAKTFTSKRENSNKKLDQRVINLFPDARVFQIHDLKEFKNLHNTVILFLGAGNIDRYIKEFV